VGKGDQTTSKIEGIRIEYFCFVKAAVEWAARNKFHKACKPLTNCRQVDTKHVKDASCAVATSSCEISLPFFQGIYIGQDGVSMGQSMYLLQLDTVFSNGD
jgi:hypothetical protein